MPRSKDYLDKLTKLVFQLLFNTIRCIGVCAFLTALLFVFFDKGIISGRKSPLPTWERYTIASVSLGWGVGCFWLTRRLRKEDESNGKR
jgi:hypothetical protein